jgi:hypothetical protein
MTDAECLTKFNSLITQDQVQKKQSNVVSKLTQDICLPMLSEIQSNDEIDNDLFLRWS